MASIHWIWLDQARAICQGCSAHPATQFPMSIIRGHRRALG